MRAKKEETKEEATSYKQPPKQVPVKSSQSVENRRRGEDDSQQDALSLVMWETARKVPAKSINVAEEKAREETSMLEPPVSSIPTQPKDRGFPPLSLLPPSSLPLLAPRLFFSIILTISRSPSHLHHPANSSRAASGAPHPLDVGGRPLRGAVRHRDLRRQRPAALLPGSYRKHPS